jgi:Ca2+-binding RTX toxin-like protein
MTAMTTNAPRLRAVLLAAFVAVSAFVAPVAAASEPRELAVGEGTIFAGMYSPEWNMTADLDAHAAWAGQKVTFAGIFHDVLESTAPNWSGNTEWMLEQAWQAEATPFSNLTINASAATIASGARDAQITAWARKVKAWLDLGEGRSMIIAPLQEGNGDWTPYGYSPAHYENAYRRIVDIFHGLGIDETKVLWAFAPNGWSTPPYSMADYYPGDDYVDIVGFSGYNFGSTLASWETVNQVLDPWTDELEALAPGKPILIAQTASSPHGGDMSAWIADLFTWTKNRSSVVGFVWFNFDGRSKGEVDWRVWNGSSGNAQWRAQMGSASVVHQWPLTDWFGSITGASPCGEFTPTIIGTSGPDLLVGTEGDDVIFGGGGDDTIKGLGGNDIICGGDGADNIDGGIGADTIFGEGGDDRIVGKGGADTLYGGNDNDTLLAGAGNDRVYGGAGNDTAFGGFGADLMLGELGDDKLNGREGDDTIRGGSGKDAISGNAGNDPALEGGSGNDRVNGGIGNDVLAGGDGMDILQGRPGNDRLDGGTDHDFLYGGGDIDTCTGGEVLQSCES